VAARKQNQHAQASLAASAFIPEIIIMVVSLQGNVLLLRVVIAAQVRPSPCVLL
jgi:hypothetical protein